MTTAGTLTSPRLDRITVYAGIVALIFIILAYKLLGAMGALLDQSTVEPLQQAILLAAVPVFQLSKNLFIRPSQRTEHWEWNWSHNVYVAAFVFAFSLVGLNNVVGFLAGAASGMSAVTLMNAGIQSNQTFLLNAIYSAISFWLALPITIVLCLVFGWVNHRKKFHQPWRFFAASYVMLVLALGIEWLLTIRDPANLEIMQLSSGTLAIYKLVVFPPIYTLIMMLGYLARLIYRFLGDRLGPPPLPA